MAQLDPFENYDSKIVSILERLYNRLDETNKRVETKIEDLVKRQNEFEIKQSTFALKDDITKLVIAVEQLKKSESGNITLSKIGSKVFEIAFTLLAAYLLLKFGLK